MAHRAAEQRNGVGRGGLTQGYAIGAIDHLRGPAASVGAAQRGSSARLIG
jgi:hypothetical protein